MSIRDASQPRIVGQTRAVRSRSLARRARCTIAPERLLSVLRRPATVYRRTLRQGGSPADPGDPRAPLGCAAAASSGPCRSDRRSRFGHAVPKSRGRCASIRLRRRTAFTPVPGCEGVGRGYRSGPEATGSPSPLMVRPPCGGWRQTRRGRGCRLGLCSGRRGVALRSGPTRSGSRCPAEAGQVLRTRAVDVSVAVVDAPACTTPRRGSPPRSRR